MLMLASSSGLKAGWIIFEVSTNAFGIKNFQSTFIQSNKVRFETTSSITILDLTEKHVTMIFSEHKAYWEGTTTEFKKSTLEAFQSQVALALGYLPESERMYYQQKYDTIFNNLRGDSLSIKPKVKIMETDLFDSINSFYARQHEVYVDSILVEEIWVTQDINPYLDIEIKDMIEFTNQLNPMDNRNQMTQAEAYNQLMTKGMPVKSVEYQDGVVVNHTEVMKVSQNTFNDEIFRAPKGYRKVSLLDLMNMEVIETEVDDQW